jgi:prevent-host-death family protein
MRKINIQDAKTHLSRLVEEAISGETVVLAKAGRPVVQLVPIGNVDRPRTPGLLRGKVEESPDCWAPDPGIEELFYAGDGESQQP